MTETTRIGLVDDHDWFRKTIADLIVNHVPNFTVTIEASNGKDFISKLEATEKHNLPSIVIMDINMPVMNGFETAKWLQDHYPTIKILALTLNQQDSHIIRMLALGAAGYLSKNTDVSILLSALESVNAQGYYYNDDPAFQHLHSTTTNNPVRTAWNALPEKEKEFVRLCCMDLEYKEIALKMKIVPGTLDTMREKVFRKFNVTHRIGLVICVTKNNLA